MKPHNCMIGADGHIRLTDFGLAKAIEYRTYSVVGTPKYVAPEVLTTQHRNEGYGFSVDWWSFGVTLFEILTGSNPYVDNGSDKAKVFNNILRREIRCPDFLSPEAQSLLVGLLHKNPAHRFGHSGPILVGEGEDGSGSLGEALPPKELMEHPFFHLNGQKAWLECLRLEG